MSLFLSLDHLVPPSVLHSPRRRDDHEEEDFVARKIMYLSEKPRAGGGLYKNGEQEMVMIGAAEGDERPQKKTTIADGSGGDDHEIKAPKKRAETWAQEEMRCLIGFRREMDGLFNTTKSNRHLWEQISAKMRNKGYDRYPSMCTDKWRNLLKEFKKAKHHRDRGSGGPAKMSCYKELDELLKERGRKAAAYKSAVLSAEVDSFLQFSDKGLEDAGIPFGPMEADGRSELNLERPVDHDVHTLAITASDPIAANGLPPWNWRDNSANGGENPAPYGGRVISVKLGDYVRRIGVDGTAEAIKEAIKSAFGLRTRRAFWLEDEEQVVRSLDRDMPLGNYTLHLDVGITIKVCIYDDTSQIPVRTEDKTLYTEDDLRDFLARRGCCGLRELSSGGGFGMVDGMDDLRTGSIYQGVRSLVD